MSNGYGGKGRGMGRGTGRRQGGGSGGGRGMGWGGGRGGGRSQRRSEQMMPTTGYSQPDDLSRATSMQAQDLSDQAKELTDKRNAIAGRIGEIGSTRGSKAVPATELEQDSGQEGKQRKMVAVIDQERCINCGLCVEVCPEQALGMDSRYEVVVDASKCTGCGICVNRCPIEAICLSAPMPRTGSRG